MEFSRKTLATATRDDDKKDWGAFVTCAGQFVVSNHLLAQGKSLDAFQLLQKVEVPAGIGATLLQLLKVEAADRTGETSKAYSL